MNAVIEAKHQPLPPADVLEQVITTGDLSKLSSQQRVEYYAKVCTSIGLNPLTKPFAYVRLNQKLQLYALKDATDQLRRLYGVSITVTDPSITEGICYVRATATTPDGRTDQALGVVSVMGLKAENLANALMKCETKAKRRVTLSLCGLGFLDEAQLEDVPEAEQAKVNEAGDVLITEKKHRALRALIHTTAGQMGATDERVTEYLRKWVAKHRGVSAEEIHMNDITDEEFYAITGEQLPGLVKRQGKGDVD